MANGLKSKALQDCLVLTQAEALALEAFLLAIDWFRP